MDEIHLTFGLQLDCRPPGLTQSGDARLASEHHHRDWDENRLSNIRLRLNHLNSGRLSITRT